MEYLPVLAQALPDGRQAGRRAGWSDGVLERLFSSLLLFYRKFQMLWTELDYHLIN